METRLQEILWENETIRWTGRPKTFDLLGHDSKTGILMTWIISAITLVFTILAVIPYLMGSGSSLSKTFVVTAVILFLPVVLSARPILDKKCLEGETLYAITNFRIIVLSKGTPMFLPLGKGLAVEVKHAQNGHGHLCFGSTVGKPQAKNRALAITGLRDEDSSSIKGLLFYHIENPAQLATLVA